MRPALNQVADMDGLVVIGEGERDEAPMLYIGEKVGTGTGQKMDIALDPLEGTTLCAKAMPNALAVIAMAESGSLLHAPDCYMEKIAIGGGYPAARSTLTDRPPRISNGWRRPRASVSGDHRLHSRSPTPCRADRRSAQDRRRHPLDH